jgi:hypothetical protein
VPHLPHDIERAIRERAHDIWLREGGPPDRAEAHWQQARTEIEAAIAARQGQVDGGPADDPAPGPGTAGRRGA